MGSPQKLPSRTRKRTSEATRNFLPSHVGFNTLKTPHSIFYGDCLDVLDNQIPAESIDLVFTSPPYADQRKSNYGGIHPTDYVDWFLPRAEKIKNVLKPSGSFVLNIKEKAGKRGETPLRFEFNTWHERTGLAMDRGIYLAQKELLPRQVAEPFPR